MYKGNFFLDSSVYNEHSLIARLNFLFDVTYDKSFFFQKKQESLLRIGKEMQKWIKSEIKASYAKESCQLQVCI